MMQIFDKVSLRQAALDMALRRCHDDYRKINEILSAADKFATYMQGMANLPEFAPPIDVCDEEGGFDDD